MSTATSVAWGASPRGARPLAQAPFAGTIQSAELSLNVRGTDDLRRKVELYVERRQPLQAEETAFVTISIQVRDGKRVVALQEYSKQIEPGSFSVEPDGTSARLDATFAGVPLEVMWGEQCPAGSFCARGRAIVVSGSGPGVSHGAGGRATADAELLALGCRARGVVWYEQAAYVDYAGRTPAGRPEPKGLPPGFGTASGERAECIR